MPRLATDCARLAAKCSAEVGESSRKAVPRYPPRLASIRQDHMQNKAVSDEGENVERNLWFLFEFFVQPGNLDTQGRKLGQNLHVDLFVQR